MNHSGVLSVLTFGFGYLSGFSLLFTNELHFNLLGCLLISYFTFLLVSEIEEKK
jgi:hypothetical protein